MKMKSLSLYVVFASIIILVSGDTIYQEARKKCQEDPATHLNEETLKDAFRGEINKSEFGVHALCIYKHMGILDKQFNVNKGIIRKNLGNVITDAKKLEEAVKECGVKKSTPEETAVELFKCGKKHMAPYLRN